LNGDDKENLENLKGVFGEYIERKSEKEVECVWMKD